MPDRTIDAALRLLDRQLVDKDGRLAGKVDDLEFTAADGDDGPLYLTAILAGPGALAGRLGWMGAWLADLSARLIGADPHIPFEVVREIGSAVRLGVAKHELGTDGVEAWVREHLIVRLPGAEDAPE
jgi:hypothetical protein